MKRKGKLGMTRWLVEKTAILAVNVWLICMLCLTLVTANNYYDMMFFAAKEHSENLTDFVLYGPSDTAKLMLDTVSYHRSYAVGVYEPGPHFDLQADYHIVIPSASVFLDKEGNVIQNSKDMIQFTWTSEDEWKTMNPDVWINGWINIDAQTKPDLYKVFQSAEEIRFMKITGYFLEQEFIPHRIEAAMEDDAYEVLKSKGRDPSLYIFDEAVRDLIMEGSLKWNSIYESESFEVSSHVKETTIYTYGPQLILYDDGNSIRFKGTLYQNRVELLKEKAIKAFQTDTPMRNENEYGLIRFVYFYEDTFDDREITLYSVLIGYPLWSAVVRLRYVYILTGAVLAIGLWAYRRNIKKYIFSPVNEVNQSIRAGKNHINPDILNHTHLSELYDFVDYFRIALNRTREDKDEIKRLNTALDYAKDAEESRRQLTSNLAHELKTPLAVIRSYSEGLQERIAEEKRDRYVQVIMDETDKLDTMVLEMLDLSRLEAGRVKLNRDTFSLADMAKSTFQRLSLLAEDKGLDVTFVFKDDCVVLADEIRISQVITNLASNAVKYTPEGGWIHVSGSIKNGEVYFAVRNTSEPLHYEQLNKVWETFYRTDESRNSQGTGLGLAIAKNIIELHGGKVHAKNIKDGVEFGFKIKQ